MVLWLNSNQIGDEGCKALAAALGKLGAAPRLMGLLLNSNQIGDEGCKALYATLGKPSSPWLELRNNQIVNERWRTNGGQRRPTPRLRGLPMEGGGP